MVSIIILSLFIVSFQISLAQEDLNVEMWSEQDNAKFGTYPEFSWNTCPYMDPNNFKPFTDNDTQEAVTQYRILYSFYFVAPDGAIEIKSINSNPSCVKQGTKNFEATMDGIWQIYAVAKWFDGNEIRETQSNTIEIVVEKPLFASMDIKPISMEGIPNARLFDWSPDGNQILFSYQEISENEPWYLGVVNPDGTNPQKLRIGNHTTNLDNIHAARFSPEGNFIHILTVDGFYRYDIKTSDTIQLIKNDIPFYFDYYHYDENDPKKYNIVVSVPSDLIFNDKKNNYLLLDIGTGEHLRKDVRNGEVTVNNFEDSTFDFSPDGKKILFEKVLEENVGWNIKGLAFHSASGEEIVIPDTDTDCGQPPRWAPGGNMITYHVDPCGKVASGGTLRLVSDDGSFREILIPFTNPSPEYFVFSPDGTYLAFGPVKGETDFAIMTMANTVPEFGSVSILIILACLTLVVLLTRQRIVLLKF